MIRPSRISSRLAQVLKWQYVASATQAILGALYMVLLARVLGAGAFGAFSLVTALVASTAQFFEARMQEVVVKKFHVLGDDKKIKSLEPDFLIRFYDYFLFDALSRLLPALILAALTPAILKYYDHSNIDDILVYIACIGFVLSKSGNGSATGLLRLMDFSNLIALGTAIDWGIRLTLSAVFAFTELLDIKAAVCIFFIVPTFVNAWYIVTVRHEFLRQIQGLDPIQWSIFGFVSRMRADLRLISTQIGLSISDLMAKDLDILILSLTMSLESIGLYRIAKHLVQVLWRAVDPFYLALLPEIQRLWSAQKYNDLRSMLTHISKQLFLVSIALIVSMWFGLQMFSSMLFGQDYTGLSSLATQMALWLPICAPLIWGGTLAFSIGRPDITLLGSLLGSTAGLLLFLVLVPMLGLTGAAIAWSSTLALGFSFTAIASVKVAKRKIAELRGFQVIKSHES